MTDTAILPSDWSRNPGMAMRTARYACLEHDTLEAYIDVCPPENSAGLFDVNTDAWAIAKLYSSHDDLEGVQFRDQREVETQADLELVVRELADQFYNEYQTCTRGEGSDANGGSGLTVPKGWDGDDAVGENKSLDEF